VIVRQALPAEAEAVGALRVDAYAGAGFLPSGSGYAATLRVLGFGPDSGAGGSGADADGHGTVLVAVEDGNDSGGGSGGDSTGSGTGGSRAGSGTGGGGAGTGKLLGTVMLEPWSADSEISGGPDEPEVRAFAVAPWAQGRGVGRALMLAAIDAAAASGARRLLLCTQPQMKTAQRLYHSLGFIRVPELDWSPVPGVTLLGFSLPLDVR
jgi:ribosomal protein S18 acetylase RimI-like enzyme